MFIVTSAAAVTLNKPPIKQEKSIQRIVCMKKLVLLINGNLGLRVLEFIISQGGIEITGIVNRAAALELQ